MEAHKLLTCKDCGETKAITEFPARVDRRATRCKDCENEYRYELRECNMCGNEYKSLKNSTRRYCKPCLIQKGMQSVRLDPDREWTDGCETTLWRLYCVKERSIEHIAKELKRWQHDVEAKIKELGFVAGQDKDIRQRLRAASENARDGLGRSERSKGFVCQRKYRVLTSGRTARQFFS